jgi:hypothetical protein
MRLLEPEKEEQRQARSVESNEGYEDIARRLRRKMRVHPRPSVARAASASPVMNSNIQKPAA